MSKTKGLLLAVAVAALAFTFSCSSDDGGNDTPLPGTSSDGGTGSSSSDGGGGSSSSVGGGGTGGNVVNGANEAWIIRCETISSGEACEGIIFHSDGRFQFIEKWSGDWFIDDEGTYTIDGGTINLLYESGSLYQLHSYNVSSNSLTVTMNGNSQTFTRRTGVIIGGGSSSSGGTGGNVVNGANEGWVICAVLSEGEVCSGIVFHSDNRFQFITKDFDGIWRIGIGVENDDRNEGTYTTSNATINLVRNDGVSSQCSYSVSDNTLTLVNSEEGIETYTRRTGITIGGAP